jgi:hypothetical protein
MNADHEEAVEFAKISKRENRVYVGNLSYDVKYRDLMEFMRGGGWGNFSLFALICRAHGVLWAGEVLVLPRGDMPVSTVVRFRSCCGGLSDELERWRLGRTGVAAAES